MALKVLLLRKKLDQKKKQLDELRKKIKGFEKREKELEDSVNEITEDTSEEDRTVVQDEIEAFENEKKETEDEKNKLEDDIRAIEKEIEEVEASAQPAAAPAPAEPEEREVKRTMDTRQFFGMNLQERSAFFADEGVTTMIGQIRQRIETRDVKNANITIPTTVLPLIQQTVEKASKLKKYVKNDAIRGTSRIIIQGSQPEGVWTEQCGKINELSIGFNDVEIDGYKVGGFFKMCNAVLEDSDYDLAAKFIESIGIAIGKALDKAIVYGKGVKMPLGFVTRLAQETKPSNYSETEREWKDLHTSNIKKLTGTGLALFKALVEAIGCLFNDYNESELVWIMNRKTHLKLLTESMDQNLNAAIVAGLGTTMPVVGGVIEELSFMADNDIAVGYLGNYELVDRKEIQTATSTDVLFFEDQTAFKGTARYDGKPVIAEAFALFNIANTVPTTTTTFPEDVANKVVEPTTPKE